MIEIVKRIEDANCVTHNGTMHADEVFATAFLELYLKNIKVFRCSEVDEKKLKSNTLVYDIGRGKFDHHQKDALKRENDIPYSSLGLLWKEFGRDYLEKEGFQNIDELFNYIDKDLIIGIDADDNGVFPKIEAIYNVKTISNIIKLFNPSFDTNQNENNQFLKAVDVAKKIFSEEIYYCNGKVNANIKVNYELEKLEENKKYLILKEFIPYEEAVLSNEKGNNLLYVAYPSNRGGYAIKAVPKSLSDRTPRLPFKEEWAGLEKEELEKVSGINGLNFCHTGRFIVSCNNLETVLQVLNTMIN